MMELIVLVVVFVPCLCTDPPPGSVVLSPSGTYTNVSGTTVALDCQVKGGNPLATLSWECRGTSMTGQNGTNAGIARSRLELTIDESYHRQKCVCTAKHQASPNGVYGTESVEFNVIYGPDIRLNHSGVVLEGRRLTRTCSAYGNPAPTTYWYHDGNALGTKNTLRFLRIDRQDAGNYTCIATAIHDNVSLSSSKTLNIIVLYGPDVDLSITNATENRTNLRLNCTANGVPTKYTYKWIHKIGSTVIRDSFEHVTNLGSMSTLTIPTVSLQDMGMYICEVDNGFQGEMDRSYRRDKDLCIPRIIRAQDRYVTENGTSLSINITFISFPEPVNTSIIRTDSSLPPQYDPTVSISPVPVSVSFYNKDVTVDGYMAQIHFSKVETTQKGQYQLYIKNAFDYFYTFRVVIIGKPDPPSNLVISQITDNSAVISWIPGEDNGHIQTFTLTYRKSIGELQTNFTTSKSSFTVRNLTMSTRYEVSVYASNLEGTSEIITGNFRTIAVLGRQSNITNTDLVLILIVSVMIIFALLIGAFFAIRSAQLSCQRTATQSVTQQQPAEVELQTVNQGNEDGVSDESRNPYGQLQGRSERNTYKQLQGRSDGNTYEQIEGRSDTNTYEQIEERSDTNTYEQLQGRSDRNAYEQLQGRSDGNTYEQIQGRSDGNTYEQIEGRSDTNTYEQIEERSDRNAYEQLQGRSDGNTYVQIQGRSDRNTYEQLQGRSDGNTYEQLQGRSDKNSYEQLQRRSDRNLNGVPQERSETDSNEQPHGQSETSTYEPLKEQPEIHEQEDFSGDQDYEDCVTPKIKLTI